MDHVGLKEKARDDGVDTVILAIPDMQGRLVGKRETADYFFASAGSNMCDYLFTVDIEGTPIPGFASASWEKGYGDMVVVPDASTWRQAPWLATSAIVLGDCRTPTGDPVSTSPRAILRRQIEAGRKAGFAFNFAAELEFYLYDNSYDDCTERGFQNLTPSSPYSQDYHLLRTSQAEPLLHDLRKCMADMGISIETTKGEWGPGQQEISLTYGDPLRNADENTLYKHALKELAAKHGKSVTFMAKPFRQEAGSSCHIHASVWSADGKECLSADPSDADGLSKTFRHFIAGVLAHASEATLFLAPTINSYKRFQPGSFAPTGICWGRDNRTSGFRLVGSGNSTRIEVRVPGADANIYLAYAAIIASGLAGIEQQMELPPETKGNCYADPEVKHVPHTLREAADQLDRSKVLRAALGDDVVDHYVHAARWEVKEFDNEVTDWERKRLFERI